MSALALVARAELERRRRTYTNHGVVEVSDEEIAEILSGDTDARDRICVAHGHDPTLPAVFLPAFETDTELPPEGAEG